MLTPLWSFVLGVEDDTGTYQMWLAVDMVPASDMANY